MGDTCIIDKHIDLRKMSKHFLSKSLYKRGITDIPGKGQDFDMIDGAQILRQIFQHLLIFPADQSQMIALFGKACGYGASDPAGGTDTNATLYMIVLLLILSKFIFTITKSGIKRKYGAML